VPERLAEVVGQIGAGQAHRSGGFEEAGGAADVEQIVAHDQAEGPGTPGEAGITLGLIERLAGRIPILGVCLGHQAIGQAFGGKVVRARQVMHGKVSRIRHDRKGVFADLPDELVATRYHSLAVERATLPAELLVTAEAEDGEIMGLRHRELPVEGVQFHPEALLTEHGHRMLQNFIAGGRP